MRTVLILVVAILAVVMVYNAAREDTDEPEMARETDADEDKTMSFFITSANPGTGGDLGGLRGADMYCASLAEAAGVSGKTWRAYLSAVATGTVPLVHARDRIGAGPWYNVKGERIAQNVEELHSDRNNLTKQTALTEDGDIVMGRGDEQNLHDILTGSTMEGMASTTAQTDTTCSNWTSSTEGSAIVGHHDRIGINESAAMKSWNSSHATRGCSVEAFRQTGGGGLFYCFAE